MSVLKKPSIAGTLRQNEPMSEHTSWRVGGRAKWFVKPADLDDLIAFLHWMEPTVPLFWTGLGSNILVRDGGFDGVVISTTGAFSHLEKIGEQRVRVGAGTACTRLARQCIRWGMGPSEFFAGIPGTVGGALAMNAGAHGGETWQRVESVTTIGRRGQTQVRHPEDFSVAYRSVEGPADEWFVEAVLKFDSAATPSMTELKKMLARRKETQPLGLPSCGSVFKNPPGDHAARLIESAGLKGARVGGAEVSTKHANFIINRDGASAADIEALIDHIQQTVASIHGIRLEHEVRILGEAAG